MVILFYFFNNTSIYNNQFVLQKALLQLKFKNQSATMVFVDLMLKERGIPHALV